MDVVMRQRLHHIHAVHWFYLQLWRGETAEMRDASTFKDLLEIHAWAREGHSKVREYLDGAEESSLSRHIEFPWKEQLTQFFGVLRPVTFSESVLQLASHSTHHRGQVSARLRDLGGEPPITDFVAWIWAGKPAAVWS